MSPPCGPSLANGTSCDRHEGGQQLRTQHSTVKTIAVEKFRFIYLDSDANKFIYGINWEKLRDVIVLSLGGGCPVAGGPELRGCEARLPSPSSTLLLHLRYAGAGLTHSL